MVSSGVVNSDLSSLKSYLSTYSSEIGNLDSSWKGPSHDNLVSKAEEFLSEYSSTIEGEMSAFATACDLYEQYKTVKSSLEAAQRNYNAAVNNKDSSAASSYSSQVSTYSSKLASLKSQIQASLQSASASTLTADSLSTPTAKISSFKSYDSNLIYSSSGYVFPFAKGVEQYITSHVGLRNQPTAGASTNHKGTDIGVAEGTEIHSLASGTVINAGRGDAGGFGNWVRVQQDDGVIVSYGHVSKSDFFQVGDRVEAGDIVALSGNEGVSTGPHLHLQLETSDGELLDSENYFADVWEV